MKCTTIGCQEETQGEWAKLCRQHFALLKKPIISKKVENEERKTVKSTQNETAFRKPEQIVRSSGMANVKDVITAGMAQHLTPEEIVPYIDLLIKESPKAEKYLEGGK